MLHSADNYLAVVGNPLRRSGFFYDLFNKSQFDYWYKRHVGYLECSHVDNEIAERDIEAYGEDSAFVQARIKGEFPSADADDAAIEWQLVKDAMERKKPERDTGDDLQLGVDCARFGGDEFAIAVRVGSEVVELKTRGRSSGPDMVGLIVETVNEYGGDERTLIVVDEGGMGGAGVVDPLRQTHRYRNVIGVSNNMEASDEEAFEKWDDEMWMQHIPAFLAYGKLPSDDVLLHELTTRKYEFTGKKPRQRRLESKKKMRMRKLNSPSRAESVMLSMPKAVNTGPESIPEPGVNIRSRIRWKVD